MAQPNVMINSQKPKISDGSRGNYLALWVENTYLLLLQAEKGSPQQE